MNVWFISYSAVYYWTFPAIGSYHFHAGLLSSALVKMETESSCNSGFLMAVQVSPCFPVYNRTCWACGIHRWSINFSFVVSPRATDNCDGHSNNGWLCRLCCMLYLWSVYCVIIFSYV